MSTLIICALLALLCAYAAYSYVKKINRGGGCCGEHEAPDKKVRVSDRDKSHYPYTAVMKVDGMTCSNCVRRVENSLNRLDGVWAQVQLSDGRVTVRMKHVISEQELKQAVRDKGYLVCSIKQEFIDG